jgi:hypothetical protein
MMTPGDKRWIKNWKPKGVNMNPTKTKPAKKKPAKRRVVSAEEFTKRNPLLSKLLDLKYRISQEPEWYDQRDSYTKADKKWVVKLIEDIRENKLTTLCREDMKHCNQLWRDYERNK